MLFYLRGIVICEMNLLVKNVSKSFKGVEILKNINIDFESGKIYALVGRNGSGKSVFLKMICGFYEPTEGKILQDGVNYIKEKQFPKNARCLIEKPSFLPELSGFENLKLLASITKTINDIKILETLKTVNLLEDKDKKFSQYSLGMKQKLGIAQVLMEDPDLIILDEPFNGIEKETAIKLRKVLKNLAKRNKIVIVASHIEEDVKELADIIYEFDNRVVIKK